MDHKRVFSLRRLKATFVPSDDTLMSGRAVAAARERLGSFERHQAATTASRVDDAHGNGFLLVGALLSALHGDPAAIGRERPQDGQRGHAP